jgi:hypothetical protein
MEMDKRGREIEKRKRKRERAKERAIERKKDCAIV